MVRTATTRDMGHPPAGEPGRPPALLRVAAPHPAPDRGPARPRVRADLRGLVGQRQPRPPAALLLADAHVRVVHPGRGVRLERPDRALAPRCGQQQNAYHQYITHLRISAAPAAVRSLSVPTIVSSRR